MGLLGHSRLAVAAAPGPALAGAAVLAVAALLPVAAMAQPAVPPGLVPGAVIQVDGYVFARAAAPLRDGVAPLQSLLATRASAYAARWLCQYTPTPGTRLEAPLARVSVVDVRQEGEQLSVAIRLPLQRPECVVRSLPPPEAPGGLSSNPAAPGGGLQPASGLTVREHEID